MRFEYRLSQPSNLIALSVAAIVIFFCVTYKTDFDHDGIQSFQSITSDTSQKYLMACLGGSIALCFSCAADCIGKYLLKEQFEPRSCQEFLLILTILLPSVCILTNLQLSNAVAFFWPLFHMQIMVILNVTLVFWADKMGISKSSPIVMLNSALSCATFTIHVFTRTPSWTTTSTSVAGVLYMLCFGAAIVAALYTVRITYNKNTNKNAVVLINTAAAEQQWALLLSILIVAYYVAFLVLEAGVFPHNDRNNLQAGYISANYVLLSVFALFVLTLHQRREMYQGIISQASLEIKRVFVRYVSHEIRTPLNTTLLGLNLLGNEVRDGTADTEVLTELVQDATGSCTIAIGILNDLLMYEKIDGGLLTLERAETPVWSFVEDVLKVFLIQAKSCEVELVWPQRCIKGVYAEIDKYKLSQVMRNLVSNALKFTPAGGKVRVFAEVVLSGTKPLGARALSVLSEVDEGNEEDHSGEATDAKKRQSKNKSKKIATKAKPVAKSFDATKDDFASIHRSISQASEETPPHVYSVPPGFPHSPTHRNNHVGNFDASSNSISNSLSGRDAGALFPGLVPEANSDRAIDGNSSSNNGRTTRLAGLPVDIEAGYADIQGEEGTTKTFCVSTPITQQQAGSKYAAINAADIEQGLAKTKVLQTSSPESSNESTPQKDRDFTLSERTFALAKKLFSGDQERSNLQVFPSVSMVRISVTDSGAGISKENQNRLFKEIVQFNAGKLQNGQGSGIGLWISNTIVKLHGGTIGVTSDGEGHGSTFYIDIPISKIEKGSNYSHTSPAHTDVSSKHKYNSPSCSPNCSPQSRGRSQSSPVKPTSLLATTFAPHDPLRAFISPDSTQSSVNKTSFSPQAQPHVSTNHSQHSHHHNSHAHKHAHLTTSTDHQRAAAGAFVNPTGDIPLSDIGSNFIAPHMPRTYSDQSIFTGGSNRSRGTMKSSFSTDEDGVSTKTDVDVSESWKAAIGAVAGVGYGASSAKVTSLSASQGQSMPNPFPNIPANLFPEHARKLSLNSAVAVSTAAALASAASGSAAGGSGKAPRLSIAEGRDENNSPTPAAEVATHTAGVAVPIVPAPVDTSKAASAASAPPRATTSSSTTASNHSLFDKRALIVDDSATNRKFVNRLLRTKIGTRDEAEDGQKAVDKVVQSMSSGAPYDVILMDYVMPVMDGPTATAKIRALGYKGVILGVTGNGHQPEIDLFMHSGANRILIKPLSADQFYDILLESLQPASA